MNIIFFGSSHFALPSLKSLLDKGHAISCVVSQPDKKKGRHLLVAKTTIKEFAQEQGLLIYDPLRINTPESVDFFKKLNPDLFVVIAYGQILSQEILDIPKIMAVNAHASLLPGYRGAAPINWAIINAEEETGVTLIKMTAKMDAGPVIARKKVAIKNTDTFLTLENSLSLAAAQLLTDSLDSITKNKFSLSPQDESRVTYAPKLSKNDGKIDWNKNTGEIYNLIRGMLGWPDAFTYYKSKRIKILSAKLGQSENRKVSASPGEILEINKEGIAVAAKKGELIIQELQIEGKRRMAAKEFILGHKVSAGELFEDK